MNCSDVKRVLPEIIDNTQDLQLQSHLKSCVSCSELVADLQLIASEARQLAASEEPAPRLWVKIAAELRAEGIIREPELASASPVLATPAKRRWNIWWLAPVAAALVVGGSYFISHTPGPQVANQQPQAVAALTPAPTQSAAKAPSVASPAAREQAAQHVAAVKPPRVLDPVDGQNAPLATVGTDDRQFLSHIGRGSSEMRATFESQLNAVNAYIRDAEVYVRRNPHDEDARQQLMDAYEQKAMLYQMALDHVQ